MKIVIKQFREQTIRNLILATSVFLRPVIIVELLAMGGIKQTTSNLMFFNS